MKKTGIITIILIILVIAVTSGTSYAFFTAGSVEFSIFVEGVIGSELSIDLTTGQDKILKPAKTSALNNIYTAASSSNVDFAMYELDYASGSMETIHVKYFVNDVKYKSGDAQIASSYATFLNKYVEYAFKWGKIENGAQTLTKEQASSSSSVNSLVWRLGGVQTEDHVVPTGETGKLYCFIRISPNLTDELIPVSLNNIKLEFTIATSILKQSELPQP